MNNKQTVIDMAMELDSTIGQYIADAIIDHVSYDKLVKIGRASCRERV